MNRPDTLPSTTDAPSKARQLPSSAIHLWGLHTVIGSLVISLSVVIGAQWWGESWAITLAWIVAGVLVVFCVLDLTFLNRMKHRFYSYSVDHAEVSVTQGLLVRTTMTLAVPQILSVEIIRGPLQRPLGLASVRFACVVEGETLGPVTVEEAERIKAIVLSGLERRRAESLNNVTADAAEHQPAAGTPQEMAA